MQVPFVVRCAFVTALFIGFLPLQAKADSLVFGLDETHTPTTFAAKTGVAQGVLVDTTTTIDSFGLFLKQTGGGDVDYVIYDGTTGLFALMPTAVAAPIGTKDWAYVTGLSITLDAGDTYYFGVFGSNTIDVGLNPQLFSSTGLSIAGSPASYSFTVDTITPPDFTYTGLTGTTNAVGLSTADVGLRIYTATAPTPEPASLLLLGTGLLGLAGVARGRLMR